MTPVLTFTVDLEDPHGVYAPDGRYVALTKYLLDLCDELGRKATFFTIGRVAEACPDLVRAIAARGHEVAYHTRNHVPLTEESPDRFRQEAREDKDRLEQLSGKAVTGFRAPRFSLTPKSVWAVDALGELGFRYSSSIMPTDISLFGFPGAPRQPFRWPNGLIELPLPVTQVLIKRVPYLGGIYLYGLPGFLTRFWAGLAKPSEMLWTYTHPYDYDRGEKFGFLPNTPAWVSCILFVARQMAEDKVRHILTTTEAGLPLGQRVESLGELSVFKA